jgi:NADH dehydrogenase (ubiquinone) flavoprotein 1
MKVYRPEVEARIAEFKAKSGDVVFGGELVKDIDFGRAIPDSLGAHVERHVAAP